MELTYFKNGNFYSFSHTIDNYKHLLCLDGRIVLASQTPILVEPWLQRPDVQYSVIDLNNRTVIPSFCDSHIHLLAGAMQADGLDLTDVASFRELLEIIQREYQHSKKNKESFSRRIIGFGWDAHAWHDHPGVISKQLFSEYTDVSLILFSKDFHTALLNECAINELHCHNPHPDILREFDIDTAMYNAGCQRSLDGTVTGVFKEHAMRFVYALLMKRIGESPLDRERMILAFFKKLNRYGITAVCDCSSTYIESCLKTLSGLRLSDKTVRVCAAFGSDTLDWYCKLSLPSGMGTDLLRIGGLKLLYDGSLGSQTALMFDPYITSAEKGVANYTEDQLSVLIQKAVLANIGISIHAIGDRACDEVADILLKIRAINHTIPLRLEHAQTLTNKTIQKLRDINCFLVMQPVHIDQDIASAQKYLSDRIHLMYRFKSLLDASIDVAFSTDCPVAKLNPMYGIYSAVTQKGFKFNKGLELNSLESLSLFHAFRAYTAVAHASCLFTGAGLLCEGYSGDFCVLDKDPFSLSHPEELLDLSVEETYFQGACVWQKS